MKRKIVVAILVIAWLGTAAASAETTLIYKLLPEQSTVVQTGGFAGIHEQYTVTGQFQLDVDHDSGVASFSSVEATLSPDSGFLYTQDMEELFNMTSLEGTIGDDSVIHFAGRTSPPFIPVEIRLTVNYADDWLHLTGGFDENDAASDGFAFSADAFAAVVPEPDALFLLVGVLTGLLAAGRRRLLSWLVH